MPGIPIASSISLQQALRDLSPELKPYMVIGFSLIAKLPKERYSELITIGAEHANSTVRPDFQALSTQFGIPKDEAAALVSCSNLAVSLVSTRDCSAEEIIDAAVKTGVLDERDSPGVLSFLGTLLLDRPRLKKNAEQARVSNEVLPSLSFISTTVDLRPSFDRGAVRFAVPVVVAYLRTDAQGQHIWFQATKAQVENLIKELQDTLRHIEQAEAWIDNGTTSSD